MSDQISSSDELSPRQSLEVEASDVLAREGGKGSFVKAKMNTWSGKNPEESADRTRARIITGQIRRLVPNVSGLFTDQHIARAAEVIVEQMDATMPIVVNGPQEVDEGKVISTGQTVEYVPDNKARLEAAKFVTAMVEGTPIARQMIVSADFKDLDAERKAVLLGSSAVLEALADLDGEGSILTEDSQPEIC